MNIDTRIYAYLGDGYIVCPEHAGEYPEDNDLRPLGAYSGIFDRPCGETCDTCLDYIDGLEPADDHGEDGPCDYCGLDLEELDR